MPTVISKKADVKAKSEHLSVEVSLSKVIIVKANICNKC